MGIHSMDECLVSSVLIWMEFTISANGYSPLLIKGVIVIDMTWVVVGVFAEPIGNGGSTGGGDVEEEYYTAGVGFWTAGMFCCGWEEEFVGDVVVVGTVM
mmetsp:Transcript_55772/g.167139  ORF Transcript_55772/g.167139 Transcript_55772/m.167139 type:complete len:100 (+) Transcript_55772:948-1247(+)